MTMNTKISYLYRDADNYKSFNECIIQGTLTEKQKQQILDARHEGEWFIPSAVGLPEKGFEACTEADHPWFELWDDAFEETPQAATIDLSCAKFTKAFLLCKGRWNVLEAEIIKSQPEALQQIVDGWSLDNEPVVSASPGATRNKLDLEKYEPYQKILKAQEMLKAAIDATEQDQKKENRFHLNVGVYLKQAYNKITDALAEAEKARRQGQQKPPIDALIQSASSRNADQTINKQARPKGKEAER